MNAYAKTLPISYSKAFTAVPMDQSETDTLIGKTIGELREAGYEDRESDTEGDKIIYVMRVGLFDYSFEVDADFDAYEKAQEDGNDGDLVVKSIRTSKNPLTCIWSCIRYSAQKAFPHC